MLRSVGLRNVQARSDASDGKRFFSQKVYDPNARRMGQGSHEVGSEADVRGARPVRQNRKAGRVGAKTAQYGLGF